MLNENNLTSVSKEIYEIITKISFLNSTGAILRIIATRNSRTRTRVRFGRSSGTYYITTIVKRSQTRTRVKPMSLKYKGFHVESKNFPFFICLPD